MTINDDIYEIFRFARYWDWAPEWLNLQTIYNAFPESYSILTPFAYSYLEEFIRATTHEYGESPYCEDGTPKYYLVGYKLVELAISENSDKPEYVQLLQTAKQYFNRTDIDYYGSRRNNVQHGIVHPDKWDKKNFESLIHYIATISKYSMF